MKLVYSLDITSLTVVLQGLKQVVNPGPLPSEEGTTQDFRLKAQARIWS